MQKKIAVINDLSGYGRCSLTVAIPVLSAMGHQCCPIPTAILSNHTEFPVYFFDDYTEKMTTYTDKWKELGLSFDAIATGFLGSEAQIGIVMEIVQKLKAEKTFVVVDPVMGDHGHAYETYTPEMCEQMKELVCMADVVLPNVTECCILTDTPYREENWTRKELLNMAMMLRLMGAKSVVITGVREGSCYNYQGNAVINYTDRETPYTRIIEHKHFEFGTQEKTVITREYPAEWTEGMEPYYPVNDERNQELYKKYAELAEKEKNVIFGGRLAEYRYYDMDKVIAAVFEAIAKEFGE